MKVKLRSTGETVEIEESAFDESLHERIKAPGERRSIADMDAAEFIEGVGTVVEQAMSGFAERLGAGTVDRSRVVHRPEGSPEGGARERGAAEDRRPAGSAGRATPAWADLYRTLPEWEREIRTADTDHWTAEWFRGRWDNDHGRMRQAHVEIAKLGGQRDLDTGVDTSLIPSPIAASIMELKRLQQLWGPRAMMFTSASQTLKVPRETAFAAVQRPGEGAAGTPSDPTYGDFTLTKKKSMVFTAASYEMLEDSPFNIVQMLSRGAARSLALDADLQDLEDGDGVGENQTDAVLNNGSVTSTAAIGTIVYDDIITMYRAIAAPYRANAVWVGSNTTLGYLDGLLDLNGRPIFDDANQAVGALEGGQGGMPQGTMKRRPVLEIPITDGVLVFGDPMAFGVLEDGAIRAEVSKDVRFLEDQTVWKWALRRDGAVGQPAAFHKGLGITGS